MTTLNSTPILRATIRRAFWTRPHTENLAVAAIAVISGVMSISTPRRMAAPAPGCNPTPNPII